MTLYNWILIPFFLLAIKSQGQNNELFTKKNEMNWAVNYSPILSTYTPCFQIEINHIYNDKYTTGIYLNGGATTTLDTFGYNIKYPVVGYISIGWQNGIKLLKKKRLTISSSVSNSLGIITLGDNAEQSSSFNGIVLYTTSKEIETTYCYSLLPKFEVTYNIWSTLNFYSALGYQLNFGRSFLEMSSFNGTAISVGLQFQLD
jgi:hypothetical protein